MKYETSEETELQKIFKKIKENGGNGDELLKFLKVIRVEVPLISPIEIFTRGTSLNLPERNNKTNIGRIDVLMRYHKTNYVAEIKDCGTSSFWYSMKCIGYCEYYKWQYEDSSYYPAVIMPKRNLKLEHQIIAGRTGMTIFVFEKIDGFFKIKPVDDKPYWKQNL